VTPWIQTWRRAPRACEEPQSQWEDVQVCAKACKERYGSQKRHMGLLNKKIDTEFKAWTREHNVDHDKFERMHLLNYVITTAEIIF